MRKNIILITLAISLVVVNVFYYLERNLFFEAVDLASKEYESLIYWKSESELWKAKYEALATGDVDSPYYQEWMDGYFIPRFEAGDHSPIYNNSSNAPNIIITSTEAEK